MSKQAIDVWNVEGRWENTRESVAEVRYFAIDQVAGTLEDAKRRAQEHFNSRVDRAGKGLEWTVLGAAAYAYVKSITYRISR